jgi:hypothetical protein
MTARNEMEIYATFGKFTPAEVPVVDTVTRLSPSAKDGNSPGKGSWHKVRAREIDFHSLLFALGNIRGN